MATEIDRALQEIEVASKPAFNAELLAKVADYIERHPEEFDMDSWGKRGGSGFKRVLIGLNLASSPYTVGCVACHSVRLGGGDRSANTPAEAQRLLRITDEQALKLFYSYNWPEPYRSEYRDCGSKNIEDRSWISAQRFRHFIATGQ